MSKDDDRPDDGGDVWIKRMNAAGYWIVKVLGVLFTALGPLIGVLVLYYQAQLHTKVDKNTAEVKAVAFQAAENAEQAASATKAVGTTLKASVEERREEFNSIAKKQDADLQAWKAYHTKDPDEMDKAERVVAKAIQEPIPNLAKPQ